MDICQYLSSKSADSEVLENIFQFSDALKISSCIDYDKVHIIAIIVVTAARYRSFIRDEPSAGAINMAGLFLEIIYG